LVTIATVNGSPIDDKALQAAMQSLAQEICPATLDETSPDVHAELREMALERLVARELIFQAALAQGVVADEAEIRQFFAAHPDQLLEPERVRVSHILVPLDPDDPDQSLQQTLKLKARAEQDDFAEVAKRHSVCVSAPGGGDLGYIRRKEVDPTFAEAAFRQAVGDVGEPVRTPYGYHLIKVTARDLPAPPPLDAARDRIIGFLKRARGAQLLGEWVAELRRDAEIVVHEN
jgi:peptidyl-prolyl cis-trans isomerase C